MRQLLLAAAAVSMTLTSACGPRQQPQVQGPLAMVAKCAGEAVSVGAVCVDKHEASVWRIPSPTGANAQIVSKLRQGLVSTADLIKCGATQLGAVADDHAPCADDAQNCVNDIYAVSLPGVVPARFITWFQAQVACANAGKRLLTNAEWQMAATGTPDPGQDDGVTDCNSTTEPKHLSEDPVRTGSRRSCISAFGAYDMVGNLAEWVADWVPVPSGTACPGWGAFSDDVMCMAGAPKPLTGPGAVYRGGSFARGAEAGPLAVGEGLPQVEAAGIGFRCAR